MVYTKKKMIGVEATKNEKPSRTVYIVYKLFISLAEIFDRSGGYIAFSCFLKSYWYSTRGGYRRANLHDKGTWQASRRPNHISSLLPSVN